MTGRTNRRSIFDLARMLPMKPNAWLVLAVSLDNESQPSRNFWMNSRLTKYRLDDFR